MYSKYKGYQQDSLRADELVQSRQNYLKDLASLADLLGRSCDTTPAYVFLPGPSANVPFLVSMIQQRPESITH